MKRIFWLLLVLLSLNAPARAVASDAGDCEAILSRIGEGVQNQVNSEDDLNAADLVCDRAILSYHSDNRVALEYTLDMYRYLKARCAGLAGRTASRECNARVYGLLWFSYLTAI